MTNTGPDTDLIDGRYHLTEHLARHGSRDTWCAYDTRLARHVALDLVTEDVPNGGLARLLANGYSHLPDVLDAGLVADAGMYVVTGILDQTVRTVPQLVVPTG